MNLRQCYKAGSLDSRPGYQLQFDYNADTVEALKRSIPHTEREWNPVTKMWWISDEHTDVLKGLFGDFEALAFLQGRLI